MMETANVHPNSLDVIKIVQLTDLHLFDDPNGSLLGVRTADSFQAILDRVTAPGYEADIYLVTGDISQDYSEGSYRRFATMAHQMKKPMFWLPGNHDDGPLMYRIFPSLHLSVARQIFCANWQIIMLNTQVYDNPCGYLTNEQLTFLFRCLEAHRDLNTLICMHHNAFKVHCAWLDQHDLKNSEEFVSLLQTYSNVKCVLCGHVHQENDFFNGYVRFISSPSTSIQFKPNSDNFGLDTCSPGWRNIQLFKDGHIETQVFRLPVGLYTPDWVATGY